MTPLEEARTFLSALFAPYSDRNLRLEIRAFQGTRITQEFYPLWMLDRAMETNHLLGRLLRLSERGNVHCGVYPRLPQGQGTNEAVAQAACLYADFDGPLPYSPDFPEPNIIVETSPSKFHAYWRLAEPIDLTRDFTGELLETEKLRGMRREMFSQLLERFVTVMGADPCAKDLARILRVPGTLNHKYDPACPVRLLRCPSILPNYEYSYWQGGPHRSVAWWDEHLPKARPKPEPRKWIGPNLAEPKAEHLDYALTPAPQGQRHALIRDFAAMLASVGYDYEGTMTLCNLLAQSSGYTTRDEKRDVVESVRSAFRKYGRR